MKIGDVVVSTGRGHALVSGCSYYTHAICVSVDPFILVSELGDMKWYHCKEENVTALCQAHPDIVKVAMTRHMSKEEEEEWSNKLSIIEK
jgi:hypothetical protein